MCWLVVVLAGVRGRGPVVAGSWRWWLAFMLVALWADVHSSEASWVSKKNVSS
jgi:hypothetical protein